MITASQILGATTPEAIFSAGDPDVVKTEFKALAMHWHSDRNSDPQATEVFQKINKLYHDATDKLSRGIWEVPGILSHVTLEGKKHRIRYQAKHDIAIGDMYVSRTMVTFTILKDNKDLVENFVKQMKFSYADDGMKTEFQRYFPVITRQAETADRLVLYIAKTQDVLSLRDVLKHSIKIPGTHVAWILNRLYNLANYLNFYDRTHNDLSLDSLFVSPSLHTVLPLGGWWSATAAKAPLVSLPSRSIKLASADMLKSKKPSIHLDLECIKLLGRELLGDPSGNRLVRDKDVPSDMTSFLRHPSSGDPSKDYADWTKVLRSSYGPAKFIDWQLSAKDIYDANR